MANNVSHTLPTGNGVRSRRSAATRGPKRHVAKADTQAGRSVAPHDEVEHLLYHRLAGSVATPLRTSAESPVTAIWEHRERHVVFRDCPVPGNRTRLSPRGRSCPFAVASGRRPCHACMAEADRSGVRCFKGQGAFEMRQATPFSATASRVHGVDVLTLVGEIDMSSGPIFERAAAKHLAKDGTPRWCST